MFKVSMNENQIMNTGILKIKQNKNKFISNASLIMGLKSPLVCTAAHCVFDWYKQTNANEITFITYDKQEYEVEEIYVSKEWVQNGIVDYDTAFLTLKEPPLETDNIIKPIFNNTSKKQHALIPYIQKKFLRKNKIEIIKNITFEDYIHNSSLLGVKGKAGVGSSGSPWLLEKGRDYFQFSNTSLSFNSVKDIVWGPYWGEHIENLYLHANKKGNNLESIKTYKL
ncbi:trypsin-like serine peptidase [Niallia sp. FSL W8-0951]|uniref:trypsin-like serine peptidase n=1 Tax=Niallia sp. FSL W8-0951 TaxID=2954639 RepID=UPI0030FC9923